MRHYLRKCDPVCEDGLIDRSDGCANGLQIADWMPGLTHAHMHDMYVYAGTFVYMGT